MYPITERKYFMTVEQQEMLPLFLARIGKTIIRPGGMTMTNELLEQCHLNEQTTILEVACNIGTTAIHLAKKYGSKVVAVDLNPQIVAMAQDNIGKHGASNLVSVQQGDALSLPFEDSRFDVLINEAMLTAFTPEMRTQALAEFSRVLKLGGVLVTHDLLHIEPQSTLTDNEIPAEQLDEKRWRSYYEASPFEIMEMKTGDLRLFSFIGILQDEGIAGLIRILQNIEHNEEDQQRFIDVVQNFDDRRKIVGSIAFISKNQK